jgi:protein-L-isoaspartate(D-aspartate) O-methyltransferase
VTLLIERRGKAFRAKPTFGVGFIPCVGAQGERSDRATGRDPSETQSVWLTTTRKPDETATAVYEEVWFSSDPI